MLVVVDGFKHIHIPHIYDSRILNDFGMFGHAWSISFGSMLGVFYGTRS